jgi:hypothetical protein
MTIKINFTELFYYTIIYNKMSYTNGNEYIIKSMNGIKTYDDGGGTIIEDGEITTTTMTTNDINCLFTIRAPSIITDSLGSSTTLTISSPATTLYDLDILTKTATENSTKAASTAYTTTAITNLKSASNTIILLHLKELLQT